MESTKATSVVGTTVAVWTNSSSSTRERLRRTVDLGKDVGNIMKFAIIIVSFARLTEVIVRALGAFVANTRNSFIASITNSTMNWFLFSNRFRLRNSCLINEAFHFITKFIDGFRDDLDDLFRILNKVSEKWNVVNSVS